EAEDLAQETNVTLWEKRAEYDPEQSFRSWAFKIGFLKAQNHRRKRERQLSREIPDERLLAEISARGIERQSREQDDENRFVALRECLDRLSGKHRHLIKRRFFEEVSLERLSSVAGINRNAMAQRLFRIKSSLIKCV
ncbi:MAG: sigma-70 family RNA polymerase sigma factor, partial [Verrucomicrobiota bacterium]